MRLLIITMLLTLCTNSAKAQVYIETGVPTLFRTKSSANSFVTSFGWYSHVGYNYKKIDVHAKLYSAPQIWQDRTERGLGFGVAYIFKPAKKPEFNLNLGLAGMVMQKRNKLNGIYDSNYPSLIAELRAHYKVTNSVYVSSGLTYGYGRTYYLHLSNQFTQYSADVPYLFSLGVGYRFKKE